MIQQVFSLDGEEILITGGTGFIGRWLLRDLQLRWQHGERFSVIVPTRNPARFLRSYPQCKRWPWLKPLELDIRHARLPSGFSLFVHGAMDTTSVAHQNPAEIFWTILDGTRNLLEAASRSRPRGVLLSSGAVYGQFPAGITHAREDAHFAANCTAVTGGQSHGEAKRAMECLGAIAAHSGLPVCSARLFSFLGPGLPLDGHFAIGNFIADALNNRPILIKSNGLARRSYLYAGELAHWLWTLSLKGQPGEAYNVGADCDFSLANWAEMVRNEVNPSVSVQIQGLPDDSPRSCYAPNLEKARALCLQALTSPEMAIRLTAEFHRRQQDFFKEPAP